MDSGQPPSSSDGITGSVRPAGAPSRSAVSADAVARRTFTLVRRGYDPSEVRDFLNKVAQSMATLQRRAEELSVNYRELDAEVGDLRRRQGGVSDESYLTERLGQEATKILKAAHAAAADAIKRAEAEARSVVAGARTKADELVAQVESVSGARLKASETAVTELLETAARDAAAVRADGNRQAEEILGQARRQGRDVIRQVRAMRSEILTDLAKRRKELAVQVEQLQAGRDALAQSLRSLQRMANDASDEYARGEERARDAARDALRRAEAADYSLGSDSPSTDDRLGAGYLDDGGYPDREAEPVAPDRGAGVSGEASLRLARPEDAAARAREATAEAAARIRRSHPLPAYDADELVLEQEAVTGGRSGGIEEYRLPEEESPGGHRSDAGSTGADADADADSGDDAGRPAPRATGWLPSAPASGTDQVIEEGEEGEQGEEPTGELRSAAPSPTSAGSPASPAGAGRPSAYRSGRLGPDRGRFRERRKGLAAVLFGGRRSGEDEETGHLPTGMRAVEAPPGIESHSVRVLTTDQEAAGTPPPGAVDEQKVEATTRDLDDRRDSATDSIIPLEGPPRARPPGDTPDGDAPARSLFDELRRDVEKEKRSYYGLDEADPSSPRVERGAASTSGEGAASAGTGGTALATADRPGEGGTAEEADDATPLGRRNAVLNPLLADLARRAKRVLQDEQNELMDALRNNGPKPPVELLGPVEEQEYRYRRAVVEPVVNTASAGAAFATGRADASVSLPDDLVGGMASAVISWLRTQLTQRFDSAGIDAAASKAEAVTMATRLVTATYRECKASYLDTVVTDYAVAAFCRGVMEGVPRGTELHWVMDDDGAPCSDCDDNVLAGAVTAGEEYPTGQQHPPAHSGCRCLVVPADH